MTIRLGDVGARLPRRTMTIERPQGPLQVPITAPEQEQGDLLSRLDRIIKLLESAPEETMRQFRKGYMTGGRDQQHFCDTAAATIPGGAPTALVTVLTFTVNDNFEGAIQSFGFNTTPVSALQDIKWSLRVDNNLIHPGFDRRIFYSEAIAQNVPFEYELLQRRTIEILATNTSAVDIDVDVRVSGYQAYMSEWKKWGTSPQSGI
jgi:hypothetical protein